MIIIGHRGASGLAPENTLPSFDKALEHKAAIVEFDVRLTKDNQLVVFHDAHTKRLTQIKMHIRDMTLKEVREFAGKANIQIPTLDEVAAHLKRRVRLNIEIKSKGAAPFVTEAINRLLEKGYKYKDFFVSSFSLSELKALHKLNPRIRLGLLHRAFPLRFLFVRSIKLYAVGFSHLIALPFVVPLAKKRKLFTYCFTVNNRRSALMYKKWGFDAICTDYPDEFARKDWHLIDEHERSQALKTI